MSPLTTTDQRPSGLATSLAVTILLTGFVAATYGFGFYLFAQLVPDMRRDLGFGYAAVGTITAAAQCGFLGFAVLGGWLSARIGGGLVVIGSAALCGLCLLLLSAVQAVPVLAALLIIIGGTAASVYVPMIELVGGVIPHQHRGKVLGLVSSGTSYGVFLNSLLVPRFLTGDDWRGVWLTVGAITLALAGAGAVTFRHIGLLTSTVRSGTKDASVQGPASKLLVLWVVLIWVMTFLNGLSMLPFQNYLSPYLREELGFSVEFAADVWATLGIIGMVAGFAVGWISDKAGVRFALVLSYACVATSAAILVMAPIGVLPVVAGVLFAFAFYPVFGLIPAYVSKVTDGRTSTRVFAIANVTLGVGGICGNFGAGLLKNVTGSFVEIYVVVAILAIGLIGASLMLPGEGGRLAATNSDRRSPDGLPESGRNAGTV